MEIAKRTKLKHTDFCLIDLILHKDDFSIFFPTREFFI